MIRLTIPIGQAVVAVVVAMAEVAAGGPHQPEHDEIVDAGAGEGQDPFAPVADLAAAAQEQFRRHRGDQVASESTVTGAAGSIERCPQLGPQPLQLLDRVDLAGAGEAGPEPGDAGGAPRGVTVLHRLGRPAAASSSAASSRMAASSRKRGPPGPPRTATIDWWTSRSSRSSTSSGWSLPSDTTASAAARSNGAANTDNRWKTARSASWRRS